MGSKRNVLIAAGVIIVAVIAWFALRSEPEPEPQPTPPPAAEREPAERKPVMQSPQREEPSEPEPPQIVEPPEQLEKSDSVVMEAVQDLAPKLTAWLTPDQQIRKWVLTVDNVAAGNLLTKHRPVNYDVGSFKVENQNGKMVMSEANYERADKLIDTVLAIPPEQLARYYEGWQPTLEKAYDELGRGGDFDERLRAAIDRVLKVEPLEEPPELEQPSVFYTYADEDLEEADQISKLMWRLGPDNTRRIQEYLRELKQSL